MKSNLPERWIDGLHGGTSAGLAARRVLGQRLEVLPEITQALCEADQRGGDLVEELRGSAIRADAALRAFHEYSPDTSADELSRRLRRLGKAAAGTVRCRHDLQRLTTVRGGSDEAVLLGLQLGESELLRRSAAATAALDRALRRNDPETLHAAVEAHLAGVSALCGDARHGPGQTLLDMARQQLPTLVEALRLAAEGDLEKLPRLRDLRRASRRLRHAMELYAPCFDPAFKQDFYRQLEDIQERLDGLDELDRLIGRFDLLRRQTRRRKGREVRGGLRVLRERLATIRNAQHRAFLQRWHETTASGLLDELCGLVRLGTGQRGANGNGSSRPGPTPRPLRVDLRPLEKVRVAAIDVGTNSIRLVVAESDPRSKFRIIEDVKETTRLGSGLYFTGQLRLEAVRASVRALGRLKAIAQQHHVSRIRAIATAAVREAANGAAFAELVKRRVGLTLETIPADEEARLAHASVANSFDLENQRIAVVDIGGGSTEVVFSTHGFVDTIAKLPLGAVHLTEAYAGRDGSGRYEFDPMVAAIDKTIQAGMPEWHNDPDTIIGTGGTFTTLAKISLRRGLFRNEEGRLPFNLRGYQLRHTEVRTMLDWLRNLPLAERRKVPGISSRRAEIVVAGLAIVERLMATLQVDRVSVHDGGIRDGLLTQMIDELGYPTSEPRMRSAETVRQVRAFAHQCGYEPEHAEHVSRLSLQILDQLVAQAPERTGDLRRREQRDLLQAAAVLHEIGQRIDYRRHHRHTYDLIVKSHLSIFSPREIEIIANVARYHRRGGPDRRHRAFRKLASADQRLVCELAGILRIADGLDRTHMQNVQAVAVHVGPRRVRFGLQSDHEPSINLRYAEKKSDVFSAAFGLRPEFYWRKTPHARQGATQEP